MAKTNPEIQKRLKILEKILSLGITTEDEFKKLTPKTLTKDEDVSFQELESIHDMQEAVKNNKLFSFLAKGSEPDGK